MTAVAARRTPVDRAGRRTGALPPDVVTLGHLDVETGLPPGPTLPRKGHRPLGEGSALPGTTRRRRAVGTRPALRTVGNCIDAPEAALLIAANIGVEGLGTDADAVAEGDVAAEPTAEADDGEPRGGKLAGEGAAAPRT